MPKLQSALEKNVSFRISTLKIPVPIPEYRFCETRRFRFDFAWPDKKIAVECEGGIWIRGAHTRGGHYNSDCEKYNLAAILGWKVLRYSGNMLEQIIPDLKQLFNC